MMHNTHAALLNRGVYNILKMGGSSTEKDPYFSKGRVPALHRAKNCPKKGNLPVKGGSGLKFTLKYPKKGNLKAKGGL